jgi:hypothetical protein
MTQDVLRAELEQLFPDPGRNDWRDVLARAPRRRFSLSPARVALAFTAALLVVMPALAATGTLQTLWSHPRRALEMTVFVRDPPGARVAWVDSLKLQLPGTAVTSDRPGHLLPHRMGAISHGRADFDRYGLRWQLSLPHRSAHSAVLVYRPKIAHAGRRVAVICSPCSNGDSGTLTLSRNDVALLVNGRLALKIETGKRTAIGFVPRLTQRGLLPRGRG